MKTTFRITALLLLLTAITTTSCRKNWPFCLKGKGAVVEETRNVSDFSEIELEMAGNVVLVDGASDQSWDIRIEAQENLMEFIKTDVRGGVLELDMKHGCIKSHDVITFYIKVQEDDLRRIKISGSGDVSSQVTLSAGSFTADISGSGNINLPINCTNMDNKISGSGDITLTGSVTDHDIHISGSGNINGFDFPSGTTSVKISGSGDAEVNVSNHLDVDISGSGNVFYRGTPTVNIDISGSGDVINSN